MKSLLLVIVALMLVACNSEEDKYFTISPQLVQDVYHDVEEYWEAKRAGLEAAMNQSEAQAKADSSLAIELCKINCPGYKFFDVEDVDTIRCSNTDPKEIDRKMFFSAPGGNTHCTFQYNGFSCWNPYYDKYQLAGDVGSMFQFSGTYL